MKNFRFITVFTFLCLFLLLVSPALAAPGDTTRVSVHSSGAEGNNASYQSKISTNGDFIVFCSYAENLVDNDTNGRDDIFVHNITSGSTSRVSVSSTGTQADDSSLFPSISADGRIVVFASYASNLVSGDINDMSDIFVHDRLNGTTNRVSVSSIGVQGNLHSIGPSISADGRYVAFESYSSDLVIGDTNGVSDVFVHDTSTGSTSLISVNSSNQQGNNHSRFPSISNDGRYVAFQSSANNLVANDTNGYNDIFVRDTTTGTTILVSGDALGTFGNGNSYTPSISADGRFVAFSSIARNLIVGDTNGVEDIFVHDTTLGTTIQVSKDSSGLQGNNSSYYPAISADGRYVAFHSTADNLVAGDTNGAIDTFVHDTASGITTRVSLDLNGIQGNATSVDPSISGDGRLVVFHSDSDNLVSADTNGRIDVFLHEVDFTPPTVVFGAGSVPPAEGAILTSSPADMVVRFSQNVFGDGSHSAANSTRNYMLVSPGANATFDTLANSVAVCDPAHTPIGDDAVIGITGITYNPVTYSATLSIDPAALPLVNGNYRLYVCGESSVRNLRSIPLNSGSNSAINFSVNSPAGPAAGRNTAASSIPATGFARGRLTHLPLQTVPYSTNDNLVLEIPSLEVTLPVVGVPETGGSWDVSWLGENAGWLEGTSFPTWEGNSVITGHVWNADNSAGPFHRIENLGWGDKIAIRYHGQEFIFEVRETDLVKPIDVKKMLRHEESPWLTLVTCKGFDESSNSYRQRVLVRAALVDVR